MTTAGNWSPAGAPVNGDSIVFPASATIYSLVMDLFQVSLVNITFNETYSISGGYGALTVTGTITVSAGNFAIGLYFPIVLGAVVTINNSMSPNPLRFGQVFSETGPGVGGLIITGPGTTRLTATNTYTGTTTVNSGILAIGDSGATGAIDPASVITVTSPGILEFSRTNTLTQGTNFSSVINGTGGLQQVGTGPVFMNGNNTFSGGFTIKGAGEVTASTNNAAMGTGTITFAGGSVRLSIGNGRTLANNIVIGNNTGATSRGLIENVSSAVATLSGTITINASPTAGSHFGILTGGSLTLAGAITSSASVTVLAAAGAVVLSGAGTGYTALSILSGTVTVGAANGISTTAVVTLGATASATLDLAGFSQTLASIAKSTNAAAVGNSSTATNSTLTLTGDTTFAGVIQNVLGSGNKTMDLTVNGSGKTVTLSGANTYTGATTVTSGTLRVTGSLAVTAVSVASGATLGGTGTIGGTITAASGGIVAPGLSGVAIGQLNTAAVNIPSGAILSVDLNGTTPTFDKLNATGTVTLGGTLTVADYTNPAVGKVFTIVAATTLSGAFNGLADGATFTSGLRTLRVNYPANTATLTDVTPTSVNSLLCFVP